MVMLIMVMLVVVTPPRLHFHFVLKIGRLLVLFSHFLFIHKMLHRHQCFSPCIGEISAMKYVVLREGTKEKQPLG
jgi:hypothetical protein